MHLPSNYTTRLSVLICFLSLSYSITRAQSHGFGFWGAWFNNVKFSERWGMNNDIQLRLGEDWRINPSFLVRPGINYYISDKQTASIGYATTLAADQLYLGAPLHFTEQRIWQQYIINGSVLHVPTQHRFRLEQRFLRSEDGVDFSQRIRYFIRGIIPLASPLKRSFVKGPFVALQNELFFHLQNNAAVNGKFFDQNRAYASLGYRFSSKYDLEIGYLNQFLLTDASRPNGITHLVQMAFYSRL